MKKSAYEVLMTINVPEEFRAYAEGHYIANHGYSHIYSKIYQSPEEVISEFNKCNESIIKAIGVPEYKSHLFRFPGGSIRRSIFKSKSSNNKCIRTK